MDWYTWNPKLYLADTLDFTLAADGAYRRLIDYYMETRAPIPSNKVALCRILGVGQDELAAIAEQVLSKFTEIDGKLHHDTCNENLEKQDKLSKTLSDNAKAGHRKRNKNKAVKASTKQKPCNSTDTGQDKTGQDKKEETVSNPKPKKGRSNGKTRIADDWQPNTKSFEIGGAEGYTEAEVFYLADGIRDWANEGNQLRKSWDSAFYNWIRSDISRRNIKSRREFAGDSAKADDSFAATALAIANHMDGK